MTAKYRSPMEDAKAELKEDERLMNALRSIPEEPVPLACVVYDVARNLYRDIKHNFIIESDLANNRLKVIGRLVDGVDKVLKIPDKIAAARLGLQTDHPACLHVVSCKNGKNVYCGDVTVKNEIFCHDHRGSYNRVLSEETKRLFLEQESKELKRKKLERALKKALEDSPEMTVCKREFLNTLYGGRDIPRWVDYNMFVEAMTELFEGDVLEAIKNGSYIVECESGHYEFMEKGFERVRIPTALYRQIRTLMRELQQDDMADTDEEDEEDSESDEEDEEESDKEQPRKIPQAPVFLNK